MDVKCEQLSRREERVNFITHFIGLLLSVLGFVILVLWALIEFDPNRLFRHALFGLTLIGMYGASSWYHAAICEQKKAWLRRLDHAAIYLLIAGSYTPLCDGFLLYLVWTIGLVGAAWKLTGIKMGSVLSLSSYLAMGWIVVFGFSDLLATHSTFCITGLVAGGLFYTVGTIFYVWKSLPYSHGIWHLFVLLGSSSHFFSVLYTPCA